MPPKAKIAAPIDRPLSRAYLRQFLGWSTAYPPGLSQPNSLRRSENVMVNRDGSVRVRPGLRYLTYDDAGVGMAMTQTHPGEIVGSHEVFFLNDGRKAYLFAVRELDNKVGFRVAIANAGNEAEPFTVVGTNHADVGLGVVETLWAETTYVKYLQIDNKILALNNSGDYPRIFYVGSEKKVTRPTGVTTPIWSYLHKPEVVHAHKASIDDPDNVLPHNNPSTPTTKTLMLTATEKADDTKTWYNLGYYYTYSNEIGESAASQITVVKVRRPWSQWKWELPTTGASAAPSGTDTTRHDRVCDQLFIAPPSFSFDTAVTQKATHINVYCMMWSDQEPVPIEGQLIGVREITSTTSSSWTKNWVRHSPAPFDLARSSPAPTFYNRFNFTDPSGAANGIVAGDRMVLVYNKYRPAVITWTSNRTGEYLNRTSYMGGGYKTLTYGNLYVPAAVQLWQNPQSADTITILCLGVDGKSAAFYMAPAQVASQSDATNIMGFEETTATPGTVSPYGCEVLNNSLYHPMEDALVKSTASNYNINHKDMTDLIRNQWIKLINKIRIVSSHHENRLYYLVHNPDGEPLEPGCWGNEVWVNDTAAKEGTWSRWLVQGQSLRRIEVNGRVMMSITKPSGIFAFDENRWEDDYVTEVDTVDTRPIVWYFETNTQGANRAHDAWAHLQQLTLTLGNFEGEVQWGIRGFDVNGKTVDIKKRTRHAIDGGDDSLPWDVDDHLQIRRDMKEWRFHAGTYIDGGIPQAGRGQISLVQYRYAPVSVNVGYEYGSVETFQYGGGEGNDMYPAGVPLEGRDLGRP